MAYIRNKRSSRGTRGVCEKLDSYRCLDGMASAATVALEVGSRPSSVSADQWYWGLALQFSCRASSGVKPEKGSRKRAGKGAGKGGQPELSSRTNHCT